MRPRITGQHGLVAGAYAVVETYQLTVVYFRHIQMDVLFGLGLGSLT